MALKILFEDNIALLSTFEKKKFGTRFAAQDKAILVYLFGAFVFSMDISKRGFDISQVVKSLKQKTILLHGNLNYC